MAGMTAAQVAEKWRDRAKGSRKAYVDGINGVTSNPGQLAAAQADKMLAKIREAVESGRWANRVGSVTLEQWRNAAIQKGSANYENGITAGASKYGAFAQVWVPLMQQAKEAVRNMPNTTKQDKLRRVEYIMDVGEQYKNSRR